MTIEMPLDAIIQTIRTRTGRSYKEAAERIGDALGIEFSIDMFNHKFRQTSDGTRHQLDEVLALVHAYYDDLGADVRIKASEALQIFSETRIRLRDYANLEDLFSTEEYQRAWQSILPEGINTMSEDEQPLLFKPLYPQYFIGRDEDVDNIKERLGVNSNGEAELLTVIRGWPGVGKTTFVNRLLYDEDIEAAFPDGILWATVGPEGNILEALRKWARQLGAIHIEQITDVEEVVNQLRSLLKSRQVLLIVDDVWEAVDGMVFKQIAFENVPLILTTRFTEIAHDLAARDDIYILDVLTEDASMELFEVIAPTAIRRYEEPMRRLAVTLEGLPLALRVAGSLIEREEAFGLNTVSFIEQLDASYELIKHKAPADRIDEKTGSNPTIELLFQKSVETLSEDGQLGFTYLGAFAPKPATFDLDAIQAIWEDENPIPLVRSLIMRGLLEPIERDRFQMHYTLSMYANLLLDKLE